MKRAAHWILGLCVAMETLTLVAAGPHPFEPEIQAFESSDKTNPPPQHAILFLGSSSIRKWTTLAHDFPDHRVINRGFGGSQISDSIAYLDRLVLPYHPRQIIFYAGSNDIDAGKTPDEVFRDFKSFVAQVESKLPDTRIDFISIAPSPLRWHEVEKVKQANEDIAAYIASDPKLTFINVFPKMLTAEGKPKPEIYQDDRLHMNPKGYAIWTAVIAPYLDKAE